LQIRSLRDRQQFHDPDGIAAGLGISSALWPLFGLLWPSGLALADLMATRTIDPDERILELGCGLGLASLVSHRRGADITASDCHPLAARFLRVNSRLNRLAALPYRHGHWSAPADASAPAGEQPVQGRFDLIVGSDVLYERDDGATLSAYIDRHAAARAEVMLIDPNRGVRAAFGRQMAARGFELIDTPIVRPAAGGRPAYRGRSLSFRRD
jgi:predicted nicotinamide N-methyase